MLSEGLQINSLLELQQPLVNCVIMVIGSVASTDIHGAMLRELTAGNIQTKMKLLNISGRDAGGGRYGQNEYCDYYYCSSISILVHYVFFY